MKKFLLAVVVLAALATLAWIALRAKPDGDDGKAENTTAGTEIAPATEQTTRTPRVFKHRNPANTSAPDPLDTWDKEVNAVLQSEAPDTVIADKLLALYPQVPTNGQADLMLEIASHVANTNYDKLARFMTNASEPEEVLETLLTDLIDRPDSLRLPLMLEVARAKDNPKSEDARDLLEVILGENYGEDWEQWSKKISEWLASHPE